MGEKLKGALFTCAAAGPGLVSPGSGARRHFPRTSRRPVCVLFAGLVGLGCGGDATGPKQYLWPEDRGTALTPAGDQVRRPLAWSMDGGEIFFHCPDGIKAVEISTGSIRVVDDRHSWYWGLTPSTDGERVYFAARDGDNPIGLYSVSTDGAQSELLESNLDYLYDSPPLAVSPDDVHIAYRAHDYSLFLHNVTDHATVVVDTGIALTFSSDGADLLYGCSNWPGFGGAPPCATFTYNLDTQQSEHVFDADHHIEMLRWDTDAIRVLLRDFDGLTVWDVTHDVATELNISMQSDELLGYNYAWSFDGSMIAVWTGRCLERNSSLDCVKSESRLHAVDADGRGDSVVAVVHSSVGGAALASGYPGYCAGYFCGYIAFSPDGRRVAYIRDERIYMQDLP